MLIFVIPGLNSHNPNRKFEVLKKHFSNETIIGLSYPSNEPDEINKKWSTEIDNSMRYYNDGDCVFLGTSLGGFWAKWFASKYTTKCILINPSLKPFNTLHDYVGLYPNCYTNTVLELSKSMADGYRDFDTPPNASTNIILLDEDDEVIPFTVTMKIIKTWGNTEIFGFKGGSHVFEHMEESIPIIQNFLNLEYDTTPDETEESDKYEMLKEVIKTFKKRDKTYNKINDIFNLAPESEVSEGFRIFDEYIIKLLTQKYNDDCHWISWYIQENDCGRNGLKAGYDDTSRKINSVKRLIKLLED